MWFHFSKICKCASCTIKILCLTILILNSGNRICCCLMWIVKWCTTFWEIVLRSAPSAIAGSLASSFFSHTFRESQTSFLHNQWGFQPVRQSARIWSVNSVLSCWHFRQLLSIRSVPAFLNAYRNKAVPCSAYLTQDFVAFHEKHLNAHDFFLES